MPKAHHALAALAIRSISRGFGRILLVQLMADDFTPTFKAIPHPKFNILLMVQKSGLHQLRLVVYPIIYKGLGYIPGG